MAFRRNNRRFFRPRRSSGRSRSARNPHNNWVGVVGVNLANFELNGGIWFSPVLFFPLIEVADYGEYESLDPQGVPSKQEQTRVLKMVGDININVVAGDDSGPGRATVSWYIAAYGTEEVENALANPSPIGVGNYDPLEADGRYLFTQNRLVEMHQFTGQISPTFATTPPVEPARDLIRSYRFNKRMSLPLKVDEELYLVVSASATVFGEDSPIMGVSRQLRFLLTD